MHPTIENISIKIAEEYGAKIAKTTVFLLISGTVVSIMSDTTDEKYTPTEFEELGKAVASQFQLMFDMYIDALGLTDEEAKQAADLVDFYGPEVITAVRDGMKEIIVLNQVQ